MPRAYSHGHASASLSSSAISKLITRLELRLGVRLINRTTRRLALTAEGEILSLTEPKAPRPLRASIPQARDYGERFALTLIV
jgi:hypothetical protein